MSVQKSFLTPSIREGMLERHQEAMKDNGGLTDSKAEEKKQPRFHDIFAAPIKLVSGWVAPNIRKSESERQLIFKSLKKNFVFASLDEKEIETFVWAMDRNKVSKGSEIRHEKKGSRNHEFSLIQLYQST